MKFPKNLEERILSGILNAISTYALTIHTSTLSDYFYVQRYYIIKSPVMPLNWNDNIINYERWRYNFMIFVNW